MGAQFGFSAPIVNAQNAEAMDWGAT